MRWHTRSSVAPAEVTVQRAELTGLERPLQAALLADLHYGPRVGLAQVELWIEQTMDRQPDLILLLGDYLDVNLQYCLPLTFLNLLGRLHAPLGVFGVWGNHDYGSFGLHTVRGRRDQWQTRRSVLENALAQHGIRILRERSAQVRPDLLVAGVDDPVCGTPSAAQAWQGMPAGPGRILMSHSPAYIAQLPQDVGLVVSGHTHGGQIRLPHLGAPGLAFSRHGQRFAQGFIQGDGPQPGMPGARGFVTRGLGVLNLPVRHRCSSEIALLELFPGNAA